MDLDYYLSLITSEHRQRPIYRAVISALMQGPVDIVNLDLALPSYFDLDTAVGSQLDSIGVWVGISRRVAIPLSGVYFEWDTFAIVGWDLGNWKGPLDPDAGIVDLTDGDYRTLIRAKIAANNWDGTVPAAVAALALVFPEQTIVIQDNQDMTMDVIFLGPPLTAVERALILGDYLLLRPVTVQSHTYSIQPVMPFNGEGWLTWDDDAEHGWDLAYWYAAWMTWDDVPEDGWDAGYWIRPGPVFAWDTETVEFSGWETGSWVPQLLPT